jgi:hypothetical protein
MSTPNFLAPRLRTKNCRIWSIFGPYRATTSPGLKWRIQEGVAGNEGVQILNPSKFPHREGMQKLLEEQMQQRQEMKLKETDC